MLLLVLVFAPVARWAMILSWMPAEVVFGTILRVSMALVEC